MLQERFAQLAGLKGVRQSAVTIFGALIASGLAAIAIILLTRQLGPIAFGQFSVGFALLLILVRLNDWGLTTVLHRFGSNKHTEQELTQLFSWATSIRFISWMVTVAIGLVSYQWLAQLLRFDQPQIILWAFLLTPIASLGELLQSILQSLHRFYQSAAVNAIQGGLKMMIALGFWIAASSNAWWLLVLYATAPAWPFIWPRLIFPPWFKLRLGQLAHPEIKLLRPLMLHAAVAAVIAGIVENVDILFVQRYLNEYEVGLLAGITRIALLFAVIAYALSAVLNPRAARYSKWKDQNAFLKKGWLLLIAACLVWFMLAPLSTWLVLATIGPAYVAGSSLLTVLLAASLLTIGIVPFVAIFYSVHKPWFFSLTAVVQLVIVLVGNMFFVPLFGLEAAVWTRLIARVVLLVMTLGLVGAYFYLPARKARQAAKVR